MAADRHEPPAVLLAGIRAASALEGIEVTEDPIYIEDESGWALPATVRLAKESDHVPAESRWIVRVRDTYPLGQIGVYPATRDGITKTFPHQEQNRPGPQGRAWRDGKLCLDSPVERLGRVAPLQDPIGDADERLRWYLLRTREWLTLASEDRLVAPGDPFELPWCSTKISTRLVHDESADSFAAWNGLLDGSWGMVVLDDMEGFTKAICALKFQDRSGATLRTASLRVSEGGDSNESRSGVWWLWPRPVIVPPWHFPTTWGELREAGRLQGITVDDVLQEIAKQIRGKEDVVLLVGYPIPLKQGEPPVEVHWQGLRLPALREGGPAPDGFRPNELGHWMRDRREAFGEAHEIDYVTTENWHPDRLLARGRIETPLRSARVAILGCGALGSAIAEILVRGGVHRLVLVDNDSFSARNLVRHTLTSSDIGRGKASALADRLKSVTPTGTIKAHEVAVPVQQAVLEELLQAFDLIVDCTASDEALSAVAEGWWSLPRLFVSASVGYRARRTFVYFCSGNAFDLGEFRSRIEPLLHEERGLWQADGETLEGAGCWSPLFPARFDDVVLAAIACVKAIEDRMKKEPGPTELLVFEQVNEGTRFGGLRVVESPPKEHPSDQEERSDA
jgi:hypothetical protein